MDQAVRHRRTLALVVTLVLVLVLVLVVVLVLSRVVVLALLPGIDVILVVLSEGWRARYVHVRST